MGMDVRSSYIAVPPPREIASEAAEDGTAGVARGRHMRITGVVTFISLASAAACTAAWFGGSQGGRTLASLRSQVRLEEEKECKAYEKNIDYRGLKDLRQIVKVSNSRKCRDLCSKEAACAAWTWGRLRNVFGFSDVCFLKQSIPGGKAQKYFRFGAVAGVKTHTLCEGTMEEPPSMLIGHVQSRDGMCLEAFPPVGAGSQVSMASCMDGKPTQEWTYTEKSGQMKNGAGLCLDAIDKVRPFVRLQMYPCDSGNWSQQWMFDNDTGLIKSWRGACIDAAERNIEGGMVYIQTCNVANQNQQWLVGAHGPEKPQRQYPAGTLYCFALMLPDSYETDLLRMQHRKGVSLFACDAYSVYSNKVIQVGDVKTGVVNSDLKCGKGGEFGTALNLDIFLAVWTKVVSDAVFEHHDWTVKVDPDAVFFPQRLRKILRFHPEAKNGTYINNCKFGMHGPVEVLSKNAVTAWAMGSPRCVQHFQKKCGGDCFWGEDLFIDQCLWKVLGVRRDNDFRLLLEDHCDPPKDWDSCTDGERVAFHPFKSLDGYQSCLERAGLPPPPPTTPATTPMIQPVSQTTAAPEPSKSTMSATSGASVKTDSNKIVDSIPESTPGNCHTAKQNERCYIAVKWAMDYGIGLHPDWYEGLSKTSSAYEFQKALHGRPHVDCPMPCKEEVS